MCYRVYLWESENDLYERFKHGIGKQLLSNNLKKKKKHAFV